MLIETKEKGVFNALSADMICILKLPAGTFHVAFFEEHPMPGPVQPISDLSALRLKSKMHHTRGAKTLEEAKEHAKKLCEQIILPDESVFVDKAIEVDDPVNNIVVGNWTTGKITLEEALGTVFKLATA